MPAWTVTVMSRAGNSTTASSARVSTTRPGCAGGRQHLVRAAAPVRVEGGAQPQHHGQVLGGEEAGHEVDLLDADAVLAGDAAAALHALLEDGVAGGQDAAHLALVALVEEDDR